MYPLPVYGLPILFLIWERFYISGRSWLTPGILVDYLFVAFNLFVAASLVGSVAAYVQRFWDDNLWFLNTHLLDGQPVWLQVLAMLVAADFVYYLGHRLCHEVTFLWWFHAVHHSQQTLHPYLQHRGHPVEAAAFVILFMLPGAVLGGGETWVWLNFARFLWTYMVHSDIKTNLGPLKYVLVTPQYHRIHHPLNPEHHDLNYSGLLTFCDYLFGTKHPSYDDYPEHLGVGNFPV